MTDGEALEVREGPLEELHPAEVNGIRAAAESSDFEKLFMCGGRKRERDGKASY